MSCGWCAGLTPPAGRPVGLDVWGDHESEFLAGDDMPLVQREQEYVNVIRAMVRVQWELQGKHSSSDWSKSRPPAIVNTFGAGKTVLAYSVFDVLAEDAGVYEACARSWAGTSAGTSAGSQLSILQHLRDSPPVRVQVCFGVGTMGWVIHQAACKLNRETSLAGVQGTSDTVVLVECLANLASGAEGHSVYMHFDEVGELTGKEAEELRRALLYVAQGWAISPSPRRLLFLFTGKDIRPPSDVSQSSRFVNYIPMSALSTDSIRMLQERYCGLHTALNEVSVAMQLDVSINLFGTESVDCRSPCSRHHCSCANVGDAAVACNVVAPGL